MQDIEEVVLEALEGRTKKNPLTRKELSEITGRKDRGARSIIHNLREQGYRIASSASNKGYWMANDPEDYKVLCAELTSKAATILRIIRAMDARTEGQEEWQIQDT